MQDITGTNPIRLHRDTNKPDRQLLLADIEGSQPRNKWLLRTKRCIDPLAPEYTLPSFATAPPVVTKFTRDSHDVSDIEGTKSKPLFPYSQRQNHLVDDIEGTWPGWRPRHRRVRYDAAPLDHSLNVSDITGGGFRTRRSTNPLTPSYHVNGMDIADDPVKSKPRSLPKTRDGPYYSLTTKDIEGTQIGWRLIPQVNPPMEARRHFRNTNFMGDIPGAQADTLKRSICTNRRVNPLNPEYMSLDGELLPNPQTPLYKEPACVEAEAQLDAAITAEKAATASTERDARPLSENVPAKSDNQDESRRLEQLLEPSGPLMPYHGGIPGELNASGEGRREERMGSRQNGNQPELSLASSPTGAVRTSRGDHNDILVRQLKGEIRSLRGSGGEALRKRPLTGTLCVVDLTNGCSTGRGLSRPSSWPSSSSGRRGSRQGTKTLANQDISRPSLTRSAGELPRHHAASGVPPRARLGHSQSAGSGGQNAGGDHHRTGGSGGGAVVLRSHGEHGDVRTERLVLRSANGVPRVPLTPSERRLAQEYQKEISSVRDLL